MFYIEMILLGISLSIDSFSLAVSLGMSIDNKINYYKYASIVGLFHFIMPIIGFILKLIINNIIFIPNKSIFIGVIILIIINIITEKESEKPIINPLLFALSVSIDSFSIGLTLYVKELFVSCFIFSVISFIFTYTGFLLGSSIKSKFIRKQKMISVLILIMLLIYNLIM